MGEAVPFRVSQMSAGSGVWGFLLPPAAVVGLGSDWGVDQGSSSGILVDQEEYMVSKTFLSQV